MVLSSFFFFFASNSNNYLFFLGTLPHKYKIVIAGNHELSFDPTIAQSANSDNEFNYSYLSSRLRIPQTELFGAVNAKNIKEYLTNCIYLEDSEATIYGIKIYGSPWYKYLFCKANKLERNGIYLWIKANL